MLWSTHVSPRPYSLSNKQDDDDDDDDDGDDNCCKSGSSVANNSSLSNHKIYQVHNNALVFSLHTTWLALHCS